MHADWSDTLRTWYTSRVPGMLLWLTCSRVPAVRTAISASSVRGCPTVRTTPTARCSRTAMGSASVSTCCPRPVPTSGTAEILQSLYANCPQGAGIQMHLFASPAVRGVLTRYANLRVKDADHLQRMQSTGRHVRQDNIFRALARKRVGFLSLRCPPIATRRLPVHGARLSPRNLGAPARPSLRLRQAED